MWKKTKKWITVGMMMAAMLCLDCSAANAKESREMDPSNLIYIPSDMTWKNDGTELVVEGAFYNLSSEYDIVGLEETIITVYADTDHIQLVPHNGSCTYNFVIDGLEGISETYKGNKKYGTFSLIPKRETEFEYVACEGNNCRYCGGSSKSANSKKTEYRNSKVCSECGGSGKSTYKCTYCDGSGVDPAYETNKNSVLQFFTEKECAVCGGSGYSSCLFCGGSGKA